MDSLSLEYVRDIQSQIRIGGKGNLAARLRGIVTHRNNRGGGLFLGLQDITGAIQLVFHKKDFSNNEWQSIKALRKTDFISINGEVEIGEGSKVSVKVKNLPEKLSPELKLSIADGDRAYRRVGGQIILSRLKNSICTQLQRSEFVEIEPSLVSIHWESDGLEPLRIQYPGFGYNTYLVPTPFPQLLDAMLATALPRLHTVGKCFTTSYRDKFSSTEASVVFGLGREDDFTEGLWPFLIEIIKGTLSDKHTLSADIDMSQPEKWEYSTLQWPPDPTNLDVDVPTIQHFNKPEITSRKTSGRIDVDVVHKPVEVLQLSRLVFPNRHVLVECSQEVRFGVLRLYSFSIHIERMTYLLESLPLRTLRASTFVMSP